jgi:peptidase M48-like protein
MQVMSAKRIVILVVLVSLGSWAQQSSAPAASAPAPAAAPRAVVPPPRASAPAATVDQVIDRLIDREHALVAMLQSRTPVVETYLQNIQADPANGPAPASDRYFLGRMDLGPDPEQASYLQTDENVKSRMLGGFGKLFKVEYKPIGFSWMVFADRNDFDRLHYDFKYVRREFLGETRCLVFDVTPKKDSGKGRFLGRIWVEDQDYNIVRLNGTYAPRPRNAYFFHMDAWRLNLIPGFWVPAYIYSEEGDFRADSKDKFSFKAQTRIWGYDLKKNEQTEELTSILVDSPSVQDQSPSTQDATPLESQRAWQEQAENNAVERLERAGLLAPEGEVDKVLQTVVNNMMITNNIELQRPVKARVLVTTPLESFSVGNTIVISRGLVDVLPDEASLAMVLSHELAHIVLGHNVGSKYAFNDRMLFSDEATYQNLGFRHDQPEEEAADKKAMDLLKNSPYAQKLTSAGLFLRQLSARAPQLPNLLTPHLGNGLAETGALTRMPQMMNSAPALDVNKLDQIAALPLGSRLKMNAWTNRVEMVKAQPVPITSAREKMPFEVTPFFPRLVRLGAGSDASTSAANK